MSAFGEHICRWVLRQNESAGERTTLTDVWICLRDILPVSQATSARREVAAFELGRDCGAELGPRSPQSPPERHLHSV